MEVYLLYILPTEGGEGDKSILDYSSWVPQAILAFSRNN